MAIIEGPSPGPAHTQIGDAAMAYDAPPQDDERHHQQPPSAFGSSAADIAHAFHGAREDDAAALERIRSSPPSSGSPGNFLHYAAPKAWMDGVLSYLTCPSPTDAMRPGGIENAPLVAAASDDAPSSSSSSSGAAVGTAPGGGEDGDLDAVDEDDEEERSRQRRLRKERWQQRVAERRQRRAVLAPGLVHGKDYVVMGENLWMIISNKFGFDVEVPLDLDAQEGYNGVNASVVAYPAESSAEGGRPATLLEVPPSGKWNYGTAEQRRSLGGDDETPEGEDDQSVDLFPGESEQSETTGSYLPPISSATSVSSINGSSSSDPPPLLLPPSTTSASARTADRQLALVSLDENASRGGGSSDNGMECEGGGGKIEEEPRPAANKRKRFGSGLGNLGNTCFMNSTLQCLAHTAPLRRYFIRGGYEKDLNRDNPLGTGGELASQFAALLRQMWGTGGSGGSSSNGYGSSRGYYSSSSPYDTVVYPREFKFTLGKHAEQFMGYDQHDSQELATYLLDALHEDTNRVTKKPYIEKPEQGEDEADDVAADKAWDLHLKREDSQVLESFMGQVKSRVQCPRENCGRVSTTFDPFMYLSVPIPGATDRTLTVTYVPMDPEEKMKKLSVTLSKMSTISTLQKKIADLLNRSSDAMSVSDMGKEADDLISVEEICLCDVWSHEVYKFLKPEDEIDGIRDTDVTFAFQLQSVASIHEEAAKEEAGESHPGEDLPSGNRPATKSKAGRQRARLDPATMARLDQVDEWTRALEKYVNNMTLAAMMNANRSSHEERMNFFERMEKFAQNLRKCPDSVINSPVDQESSTENPDAEMVAPESCTTPTADEFEVRGVTDADFENAYEESSIDEIDEEGPSLAERCETSRAFNNITTAHDLAVFEYCSRNFHQFAMQIAEEKKNKYKDGLIIQIVFKREAPALYRSSVGVEKTFATALVLKISPRLTVHGLRRLLSERLSRVLKSNVKKPCEEESKVPGDGHLEESLPVESNDMEQEKGDGKSKESLENAATSSPPNIVEETNEDDSKPSKGSSEVLSAMDIMRQIPMTYERKSTSHHYSKSNSSYRKLGSLMKGDEGHLGARATHFASPADEGEQDIIADLVGDEGAVMLHWPPELTDCSFDENEWEAVEDVPTEEAKALGNKKSKKVTVTDCISKYCQMEQLEETEMWYCNKCKDHVRAWKQFHIYRAPPILIVHLKRFQFSSTTHRRDKIDTFIDFPLTDMDLSHEVMHWEKGQEAIYDCYAVSNHYGGLGGGHYTAYALSDDGVWCHFDDSRVTTGVSEKEVISSAAYVLYYRRKDVSLEDAMDNEFVVESEGVTDSETALDSDVSFGVPTSLGAKIGAQNSPSNLVIGKIEEMDVDTDVGGNSSRTASVDGESMSDDGNRQDADSLLVDRPAQ